VLRICALASGLLLATGCTLVGDSSVKVIGKLSGRSPDAADCVIHLRLESQEKDILSQTIPQNFEAEFVVSGGRQRYLFLVTCPGGSLYRTKPFSLGGSLGPEVVELGELLPQ
jgi:hypothetical protein